MKNYRIGQLGCVMCAAIAVGVVGCGGDPSRSVAAPTATAASASSAALDSHGGSGGSGNSGGSTNNGGPGNNNPGSNSGPGNASDPNRQAELQGTITAVNGTCPALHLTIGGRGASTTAATEFDDTTCATVAVGQMAEVKGALQPDGSIAAARVEVQGNKANEPNEGEVAGPITASTGTCPALTLTVGATIVRTTVATALHDASCSALIVGTVIEAKGVRQTDGSLLASKIEREGIE